jgi:hypothetical protein
MKSAVVPVCPPFEDLPDAVRSLSQERERIFVWAYMFNGANGAAAARTAGYSDASDGAKVRAHTLLQRDDVQAALRELTQKYLFSLAPKAIVRLGELLDKPDHKQHAKAIDMTLARTGFIERTGVDHQHEHTIKVDHTSAAVADLRRLLALGVPREKLIEVFGYSGLSRYEKLLLEEDARAGRMIEGHATEVAP